MTILTPPGTTLSTPSPTERSDPFIPVHATAMPPPAHCAKCLVVATTRSSSSSRLGIGLRGSLPWPMIKSDMAFFRGVTRDSRPPTSLSPSIRDSGSEVMNAVVMGRKTFESIPVKFRPLAGRLNVVVSRTPTRELGRDIQKGLEEGDGRGMDEHVLPLGFREGKGGVESVLLVNSTASTATAKSEGKAGGSSLIAPILVSPSIPAALSTLTAPSGGRSTLSDKMGKTIGNIFVIGGAEVYDSFLRHSASSGEMVRILQTEIRKRDGGEFECDTFFPAALGVAARTEGGGDASEWRRVDMETVKEWINGSSADEHQDGSSISLPQGEQEWAVDEKVGVELRVVGWERTAS